jgi:hypothetical protein
LAETCFLLMPRGLPVLVLPALLWNPRRQCSCRCSSRAPQRLKGQFGYGKYPCSPRLIVARDFRCESGRSSDLLRNNEQVSHLVTSALNGIAKVATTLCNLCLRTADRAIKASTRRAPASRIGHARRRASIARCVRSAVRAVNWTPVMRASGRPMSLTPQPAVHISHSADSQSASTTINSFTCVQPDTPGINLAEIRTVRLACANASCLLRAGKGDAGATGATGCLSCKALAVGGE